MVLEQIRQGGLPCVLVVNKVDLLEDKTSLLPHLQAPGHQGGLCSHPAGVSPAQPQCGGAGAGNPQVPAAGGLLLPGGADHRSQPAFSRGGNRP